MNKKNSNIYIKEWLEVKPYEKQVQTDTYYLKLCNVIKQVLTTNKQSFVLQMYLDNQEIKQLAIFLTSYFEDIISASNIWNTFVRKHKDLYHKQLPFYDLSEYYEDEINIQDISFLIWYFMNTVQKEKFIAPFNDFIIKTAEMVIKILEEAWDYAPENEHLKTIYNIDESETDFYIARNLIDAVLYKTYLFYPDAFPDLLDEQAELMEDCKDKENIHLYLQENMDSHMQKTHTRLLGLKGKDWVSDILGEKHPLSAEFAKISPKIRGFFLYKGQDEKDVFIEHIASGKSFKLTKKSLDHSDVLTKIDTIIFMGIAKWMDEWWFSGMFFTSDFNPDLVLDEKNSLESRMAVNFLDHQEESVFDSLQMQFEAFKNFTDGKQIVFMKSEEVETFVQNYTAYFNNSLNLSKEEKEAAKKRVRADGFFGAEDEPTDFSEVSESALVFFNPKSGVEIAFAANSAFPDDSNKYYNEKDSYEHIIRLLSDGSISTELAMFCIDNYAQQLPFFKTVEGKAYLKDIDFLLRFWKQNNYHTKPSMTLMGKSK